MWLSFDDGPEPGTGRLLDKLEDGNAPSTYIATGPNTKLRPAIVDRMAAEDHGFGDHTWNHRSLTSLPSETNQREIDRTTAGIAEAVDLPATLLRPPYGAHSSNTGRWARTPVIVRDVDTPEWKRQNTKKVIDSAANQSSPGSIPMMHDRHSSTVAAVPGMLAGLRATDQDFVTVSERLGPMGLEAGESHSKAPRTAANTGPRSPKPLAEVRYP